MTKIILIIIAITYLISVEYRLFRLNTLLDALTYIVETERYLE